MSVGWGFFFKKTCSSFHFLLIINNIEAFYGGSDGCTNLTFAFIRFNWCGMRVIYIEPYYGGSHKQMVDHLQQEFGGDLYTLPSSKWNWRMRMSALHFSDAIPKDKPYE
jgi:hypothetical protein